MSLEQRLADLGLQLPPVPKPIGNYVAGVPVGNLLFMSGIGPRKPEGGVVAGRVGADLNVQQGYDAAEAGKMWRIRSPKSDQAQTILADETARAFNGEVSVAEALDNAARKIDRLGL